MDNVILTTERTEMKFPLDFIDEKDIVRAIGDEDTIRFMDSVPNMTYTQDDAERFISFLKYARNSSEDLQLGIFEKENSTFIGMCTLEAIYNKTHTCELGYWLNKSFVEKGFMYECVSA